MADTLPVSETVKPESLSNDGTTATTPVVNVDAAEVERLKKEADQARMAANQARNELDRIKAEQDAAKAKQLEEKEEFKTLYEQTQARLAEIENEKAEQERKATLEATAQEVFKEYPANVVELAKTAGLGLSDDSEASVQLLKEKLDVFKKQIAPTATPSANNPHNPAPAAATHEELMARMRGGDKSAVNQYISELPAIKRMKEIANGA